MNSLLCNAEPPQTVTVWCSSSDIKHSWLHACICTCLYVRCVALSRTSSKVIAHTHTAPRIVSILLSTVCTWINEGVRNRGGLKNESSKEREGVKKLGCMREMHLFTCVCVRVCFYHLWPRSGNMDSWVFEGGGGGGGGQLKICLKLFN